MKNSLKSKPVSEVSWMLADINSRRYIAFKKGELHISKGGHEKITKNARINPWEFMKFLFHHEFVKIRNMYSYRRKISSFNKSRLCIRQSFIFVWLGLETNENLERLVVVLIFPSFNYDDVSVERRKHFR